MECRKKTLPDISSEDTFDKCILPPIKDYAYFEDYQRHPFQYEAREFEGVNAWWLAEAAMLAYAQCDFAKQCFRDAGFPCVEYFCGNSTQCYVAHNDHFVVVAFRGSEIKRREGTDRYWIADWKIDLMIGLVDSGQGSSVHEGFNKALDEVWSAKNQADSERCRKSLKAYIDEVSNDGRQRSVWFTGHSLGAALATLAAYRYRKVAGLYTFGSPRVGDYAFARAFAKHFRDLGIETYRFVNNDDVVAKVPLLGLYCNNSIVPKPPFIGFYRHVGRMKYIDDVDGGSIILDNPSLWRRLWANFGRVIRNVYYLLRYSVWRRRGELPKNSLTDHAPLFYVIHIWNDCVCGSD